MTAHVRLDRRGRDIPASTLVEDRHGVHARSGPVRVDVRCLRTPDGWIVDVFHADTGEPLIGVALAAWSGQRWPTLADAHRFARRRFGNRIASIAPDLETPQ